MTDTCICTALRQAAAQSTAHYDAALAPAGLKVTMFRLLRRIEAAERPSISALAQQMGLDRSTLGRNLRVLERQSFIRMLTGADERARLVELTAHGRAALAAAVPLWHAAQDEMAQLIGPETLAVLDRVAHLDLPRQPAQGDRP